MSSGPDTVEPPSSPSPISSKEAVAGFYSREEMLGKLVVGSDAGIVGKVKDLAISSDGRIAIQIERSGSGESSAGPDLFVGSGEIQAVSDVVLLKPPRREDAFPTAPPSVPSPGPTAFSVGAPRVSSPSSKICSRCGFSNSSTSRFCIKCGNGL
jgi:sporulation protein YlmC with PRC-barrel domain